MTNQCAEVKVVFSFGLKDENEKECLTQSGREFQMTGPLSHGHPVYPWNMDNPHI